MQSLIGSHCWPVAIAAVVEAAFILLASYLDDFMALNTNYVNTKGSSDNAYIPIDMITCSTINKGINNWAALCIKFWISKLVTEIYFTIQQLIF